MRRVRRRRTTAADAWWDEEYARVGRFGEPSHEPEHAPRPAPDCCEAEVTTRVTIGGTVLRLTTHTRECPVWTTS